MTSTDLAAAVSQAGDAAELLVALDFDGTLAPLVDDPMQARMLPAARDAVQRLAAAPRTTVALVSGRTLAHLMEISEHTDVSPIHLAGSHGAEYWHPGGAAEGASDADVAARDAVTGRAERLIADLDGAWIERKRFGFGLHTRLAEPATAAEARRRIDAFVTDEAPSWRRRTGQDILEFASRNEGKDSAIRTLRVMLDASVVLFAGDDVTDEDALASLGPSDIGIRVGDGDTAAGFRVADAAGLASALGAIADARSA